jgi:hypothetical protein
LGHFLHIKLLFWGLIRAIKARYRGFLAEKRRKTMKMGRFLWFWGGFVLGKAGFVGGK